MKQKLMFKFEVPMYFVTVTSLNPMTILPHVHTILEWFKNRTMKTLVHIFKNKRGQKEKSYLFELGKKKEQTSI